jgi:glutamate synthase domain-containing protein 2
MNPVADINARVSGVPIASGRSNKLGRIGWDDFVLVPAQLEKRPVDYFREGVDSSFTYGPKAKKPIKLEMPILIAAMSFGALSREAKIALAKASTMAGTATNTGEGGMLPEERKYAKVLIAQYSTGRFGVTEEYLKNADAVEIKIGQGAKAGQGGLLPAAKVTKEIAEIRKIPLGKAAHSPPYHPDIRNIKDLREKVEWLREVTGGKPIAIKLGGCTSKDVELAVKADPDIIAVDGMEGATGASPSIMLDDVGIPTVPMLAKARETLDKLDAEQQLLVGGGITKGADIAKALAMGADGVFLGTALLVAIGCVQCNQCHMDVCPKGITTQNPKLRKKFDVEKNAANAANLLKHLNEEVKMAAAATGHSSISELNKKDLRSISLLAERVTGIKLV